MSFIDMTALQPPEIRLWQELRFAPQPLTLRQMWNACRMDLKPLQQLLHEWRHNGLITFKNVNEVTMAYKVKKLRQPPAQLQPFPAKARPPKHSRCAQRVWAVLKILKSCDMPTLVMTAEAKRPTILNYLRQLQRAGYLKITGSEQECDLRVALLLDTGRFAPECRRIIHDGRRFIRVTDRNNQAEILLPCLGHSKRDSSPFFLTGEVNHGC